MIFNYVDFNLVFYVILITTYSKLNNTNIIIYRVLSNRAQESQSKQFQTLAQAPG